MIVKKDDKKQEWLEKQTKDDLLAIIKYGLRNTNAPESVNVEDIYYLIQSNPLQGYSFLFLIREMKKKNKKEKITYDKRPAKDVLRRLIDNIDPDSLERTRRWMLREAKNNDINEKGSNQRGS